MTFSFSAILSKKGKRSREPQGKFVGKCLKKCACNTYTQKYYLYFVFLLSGFIDCGKQALQRIFSYVHSHERRYKC